MFSKVDEGMKKGALEDIVISAAGLITAAISESGYLKAGTKKTKQLTVQAAKTVTPGKTAQTAVASGRYTTGAVTVSGDADLIPANIREGTNIFGVNGALKEGISGVDTGTVTLANSTMSITVAHNLGTVPSEVYLFPTYGGTIARCGGTVIALNEYSYYIDSISSNKSIAYNFKKNMLTDTEITFERAIDTQYGNWAAGTYRWVAIA